MSRYLTAKEIDNILSFIKPNRSIPKDTANSVMEHIKDRYRKQLLKHKIYPKIIPELKRQIEKEHQKSLVEPGESVGILAAQSIGEKNTQSTLNSVDWKELVLVKKNGEIIIQPIGKIIDSLLKININDVENIEENRTEYLNICKMNYRIPSCDEYGNTDWYKIEAITRHLPVGDLVRVITKSGRIVDATQSKSFLVYEDGKFVATEGSDIKIGDLLPTTRKLKSIYENNRESKYECFQLFLIGKYLARNVDDISDADKHVLDDITSSGTMLPELCYDMPKIFIKDVLRGFFDKCSYMYDNGDYSLSTISYYKDVIFGISFLLSYFGVFCNIVRGDYGIIYILKIDSEGISKLNDSEILHRKCSRKQGMDLNLHSGFDFINDVYLDSVVSIEFVKPSREFVYDFTVAETRNFQLFNGLNIRDTFHKAGQSVQSVIMGVPRFQELLNASKNPKMVNCKLFFKECNDSIQNLRNMINHNLVSLKLVDISQKMEIVMNKISRPEQWYSTFKILYNDKFSNYKDCISVKLNRKLLFKYRIHLEYIANILESSYDDLACVFSCEEIAQIDISIDVSKVRFPHNKLLYITMENVNEVYIDEVVLPIIEKIEICGICGISAIYYYIDDKTNEWFVETDGSNFRKLLGHPILDMPRITSNNVWDIYNNLGIEAAREMLINEFTSIMEGINMCHVILLVDKMTYRGSISSISRYTLRSDQAGAFSRASFEETLSNFLTSSFAGDIENTNGVSASIICGKRVRCGTGMIDLKMNLKDLPEIIEEENDTFQ